VLSGGFVSVVGHPGTAELLTSLLGLEVLMNRVQLALKPGDVLVVVQIGVRLQEGQVLSYQELLQLYEDGKITFYQLQLLE